MAPLLERLADPSIATEYLAERLSEGSLVLLLGAGSSKPLGLPSWSELLEACFRDIGEPRSVPDDSDLELAATLLEDSCKKKGRDKRDVVTKCLYPGGAIPALTLMTSARMGALGAMLTGSQRGSVKTVITFNYDSVLEEYLLLHGYTVRVVTALPRLTGAEDSTVFHPHGYLPSSAGPGVGSKDIVLTKQESLKMIGNTNQPWPTLLRAFMRSKVLLLIGISAKSTIGGSLGGILADEADSLKADRPTAFWLSGRSPETAERIVMLEANAVPVSLGSNAAIDEFLLAVCRKAAVPLMPST